MAHFAEVNNADDIVIRVVVIDNDEIADARFASGDSEAKGIARCLELFGDTGTSRWVQTSYNNNFRVRYAGPGFWYNEAADAFCEPRPADPTSDSGGLLESWVLVAETVNSYPYQNGRIWDWDAPTPLPEGPGDYDLGYVWDESTTSWTSAIDPVL